MDAIGAAVQARAPEIVAQLRSTPSSSSSSSSSRHNFFVVDGLLGAETCAAMRCEAEALHREGFMVPSQSTRWDPLERRVAAYEKRHVLSMQLQGGEAQYDAAPRLVEYTVSQKREGGSMHQSMDAPID